MAVCLSHGGPSLYRTVDSDPRMLVATIDGIVFLERSGVRWSVASHGLEGLHISALMIEPGGGRVFAGTHPQGRDGLLEGRPLAARNGSVRDGRGGGLFASDDGGKTWTHKDAGIGGDNYFVLNCTGNPEGMLVYAGTEPAHLYVSRDLGESWEELSALREVPNVQSWTYPGPPHVAHVKNVAFDPRNSGVIYAAVEVGGLFKSTDAGKSWTPLSGIDDDVHRVTVSPIHPEQVFVATGAGLYRSFDEGTTWERLTDREDRIAYPDALILHPEEDGLAYTAGAIAAPGGWRDTHDADARIARTRDHGYAWEVLGNGLPEHIRGNVEAMAMNLWSDGFHLYAGTTDGDVFASDDGGDTWDTIVTGLAPISVGGHFKRLRAPGEPAPATTAR